MIYEQLVRAMSLFVWFIAKLVMYKTCSLAMHQLRVRAAAGASLLPYFNCFPYGSWNGIADGLYSLLRPNDSLVLTDLFYKCVLAKRLDGLIPKLSPPSSSSLQIHFEPSSTIFLDFSPIVVHCLIY